jgi:hypothetical protein
MSVVHKVIQRSMYTINPSRENNIARVHTVDCMHICHIVFACVVILCVFTLWVPCCDVRYDFHIKTMLRYLYLFIHSAVQHMCCVFACFSSYCVPYVASFSWLSMFDFPLSIL